MVQNAGRGADGDADSRTTYRGRGAGKRGLRFCVTPHELAGVKAVAAREDVTVSRLLRRAGREMLTRGPDFFDDATARMSELAHELAVVQRLLMRLMQRRVTPANERTFTRP